MDGSFGWSRRGDSALGAALTLVTALAAAGCRDNPSGDAPGAEGSVRVIRAPAAATAETKPSVEPAPSDGPLRFRDFPGEAVDTRIDGKEAWAVVPVESQWSSVKVALLPYEGRREQEHLFQGGRVAVPGAFVHPAVAAEGLEAGDPVLVQAYETAIPARVTKTDGATVHVRAAWLDEVEALEVPATAVLALDGDDRFGEPVRFGGGDEQRQGLRIRNEAGHVWVLAWGGVPERIVSGQVARLDVSSVFRPGDEVAAAVLGSFRPAKVVEVIGDGVQYRVAHADGEELLPFTEVAKRW